MTESNSKSGLYIANTIALVTLEAFEEILGVGGVKTILNRAKLPNLINNYPPDNLDKTFDFADYASLMVALEDIYGIRGGRIMGIRVGRATRSHMYKKFGPMLGVTNLAFKILPLSLKLRMAVNALSKAFNMVTDQQTEVVEREKYFYYVVKQCPVCWGRHDAETPVCFTTVGLLKGGLNWVSGGKEFDVKEVLCHAKGDKYCVFRVLKNPIG